MEVRNVRKHPLPTDDDIRTAAYFVWKSGFSHSAEDNWIEARRRLLGQLVWQNQYLRIMVLGHIPQRELIKTFMKINKAHGNEISSIIVYYARLNWDRVTQGKLGEVQVVINETRGEVVCRPKAGFHPTDVFDMFDD